MHGSNTLGCVDRDKQEMNTMSECQVKAVRGPEKSMMEPLESMKEGGTGEGGKAGYSCQVDVEKTMDEKKRMSAQRHKLRASTHGRAGLEKLFGWGN